MRTSERCLNCDCCPAGPPSGGSLELLRLNAEEVLVMLRGIWMVMLAGFVAVMGCEQKPADRTPGKVTSEDVRRDAGQAVNTAAEFSQQTKEEFQKNLDARLKNWTPKSPSSARRVAT